MVQSVNQSTTKPAAIRGEGGMSLNIEAGLVTNMVPNTL